VEIRYLSSSFFSFLSLKGNVMTPIGILLVDDDEIILRGHNRTFSRCAPGITPATASRAQEALDKTYSFFEQHTDGWLFVLTDNTMPFEPGDAVRSGVELVEAIKTHRRLHSFVVLLTGDMPLPQSPSADCVLAKPALSEDIVEQYVLFLQKITP
jgi:CheY-like chemotaxis protein